LQQAPVSLGETLEELAHLEVIAGHGTDLRHQLLADVFGDSLLVDLSGEVVTPLGGILVKGTLEELQSVSDLALELFFAELEDFGLFAHKYAYIYAYFMASKAGRQEVNRRINAKNYPEELNCYRVTMEKSGVTSKHSTFQI
jgi:hypothetical protein